MTDEHPSLEGHGQFDAICAQLGEWEPLPTVIAEPAETESPAEDEQAAPLDRLILAGLVWPL